jgi:hypothetical protein
VTGVAESRSDRRPNENGHMTSSSEYGRRKPSGMERYTERPLAHVLYSLALSSLQATDTNRFNFHDLTVLTCTGIHELLCHHLSPFSDTTLEGPELAVKYRTLPGLVSHTHKVRVFRGEGQADSSWKRKQKPFDYGPVTC